jgi:hypothetical protein
MSGRRVRLFQQIRSEDVPAEGRAATSTEQGARQRWRRRGGWAVVGLLAFMAFEGTLVAIALQGPWLTLLAPGFVCGVKAVENYKSLRRVAATSQ